MAWSEKAVEAALDLMDRRWRNPHGDPDYEKKIMRKALDAAAAVDGGDARTLLDEAIAALEPFSDERNDGEHLWNATATDFARARATLTKLRAARNG